MTTSEREELVMVHLRDAWNEFLQLPSTHPNHTNDFRRGIHICWGIMAQKGMQRHEPDKWPTYPPA